jgi:3-deoxy-D-manno-octulosonic-acid transferase
LKPDLIVLAESELWPNFLRIASGRKIPVVVINGRMSPRSARRLRKLGWLGRYLMHSRVSKFAMQSESYAQALREIGIPSDKIAVTGSVKYDGVLGDRNNSQTKKLGEQLGIAAIDLVWVAGSTHAPEEEIVLGVFANLRSRHSALRLVLAPRSADRFDEVARLIEHSQLAFVRKSQLTGPPQGTPAVVLIDTIGDLNAAWGLADIGFTGGSLDGRRGGQSMIEPAGLGVPVVFGPHIWNFRDAAARLIEVGGAIKITSLAEMEQELERILSDADVRKQMGDAARAMVLAQQGATERTLNVLDDVIGQTAARPLAA